MRNPDEPKHPFYTEVPQRSYEAYVGEGRPQLEELLCAFVVDPDEAVDAAEQYGVRRTPHSLKTIRSMGSGAIDAAMLTISQWVSKQAGAGRAISQIGNYDRRLGIWCACSLESEVVNLLSSSGRQSGKRVIRRLRGWSKDAVSSSAVWDAVIEFRSDYQYQLAANRYGYAFLNLLPSLLDERVRSEECGERLRRAIGDIAAGAAVSSGVRDYPQAFQRIQASTLSKMVRPIQAACLSFAEPFDEKTLF